MLLKEDSGDFMPGDCQEPDIPANGIGIPRCAPPVGIVPVQEAREIQYRYFHVSSPIIRRDLDR